MKQIQVVREGLEPGLQITSPRPYIAGGGGGRGGGGGGAEEAAAPGRKSQFF